MSETAAPKTITREELCKVIEQKLKANPGIKTAMMAQTIGVPEAVVMRCLPDGRAVELDGSRMEELIRDIETLGLVYLVVRNPSVVSETRGRFGGFSNSGPFLNVSGQNIHLHLMLGQFKAVFAVTVPESEDRPAMYSFQFFQTDGIAAMKVFLIKSMQEEAGDDFEANSKLFHGLAEKYKSA